LGRGTNFVGSFGKAFRRVSVTGGAGIPLNNYRTAVLKMQASNTTVEPSHETDLQVTSEVGQIVTARPAESMSQQRTMEIEGTGKQSNISDFFSRWQLLSSGLLQTTDTSFTDMLGSAYYPIAAYLNTVPVKDKTANFLYWEGDVELLIMVTPPSNAYGLYLVQALPDQGFSSSTDCCNGPASDNPWTATQGIHAFIDITTGNSVTLKLPFYNNKLALALPATDDNIWRICLWCLTPIQNAVNSDTIAATYNIYARMPDIQLMVPHYQSKSGASSTLKRGLDTARKFKDDKTISKTAGKIASMAAMASTVPFLAPFAGPVAAGAASVMSMASMFGFTREAAPLQPVDTHAKSFSSLAPVDGQDGSEVVALLQGNTLPIDPGVGGGSHSDEMAYASLFERWTIIDTFTWDTASAALADINWVPVTPFFGKQVLGAFYPTTAGFVGFPFKYWRGGMEYKLIIPSSVYHRGMLQVFWSIDTFRPATDITQYLMNEIFDVEAGSEYTFSVDWTRASPALTNVGFGSKLSGYDSTNANGFIFFRVISQLQAVGGSAPITCVLLARAKPDMEFGVPRTNGSLYSQTGTVGPLTAIAKFQGKNVGDEEEDDSLTFSLVPSMTRNQDRIGPSLFGEEIRSVRALVQKMSCIQRQFSATTYDPHIAVPHFFPPPFTYTHSPVQVLAGVSLTPPWTWYGHFASMFACVRGSTRYKNLTAGATILTQAFPVVASEYTSAAAALTTYTGNGISGGFAGDQFCGFIQGGNGGTEWTLPGYQAETYTNPCYYGWTNALTASKQRIDIINPTAGTFASVPSMMFSGAGPDISLFRFRRVPPMIAAS